MRYGDGESPGRVFPTGGAAGFGAAVADALRVGKRLACSPASLPSDAAWRGGLSPECNAKSAGDVLIDRAGCRRQLLPCHLAQAGLAFPRAPIGLPVVEQRLRGDFRAGAVDSPEG